MLKINKFKKINLKNNLIPNNILKDLNQQEDE